MKTINNNSVSLAGEFAVLSQLALRGYDANMTLGRTKGIDILAYSPEKEKSYQLEVKTNFGTKASVSKVLGKSVSSWMMNKKHESTHGATLFYCFVNISRDGSSSPARSLLDTSPRSINTGSEKKRRKASQLRTPICVHSGWGSRTKNTQSLLP